MKTNFLNKLKQGLFLLIAVLGTFVGFSQSTPTIGGKNTPRDIGGLLDIGGGKSSDGRLGAGQLVPIVQLTNKTQCIFAYLGDTGGGSKGTSTDTGQIYGDDLDIGGCGTDTGTGQFYPIALDTGGRGGRATSTGGDLDLPNDYDDYDTGGRGAKTNTGKYAPTEIDGRTTGGKQTKSE